MSEIEDFNLDLFLKNLPNLPGVYRMFDAENNVLYVGKAVNLKRRVPSYFQKNDLSPRIRLMVKQIHHIETTVTRNETEALILENNFIKALSPKYNILFRDDKSYPYLMFSGHEFPQMAYYRGTLKKPNQYFGPYPNGYAVRDSIQILQKVFKLRTCEDSVFGHRERACLLYQIKRCSGPCAGHISKEDYRADVNQAATFLNGKTDELTQVLHHKMNRAADMLNFEEAAKYRDQIQALGVIQSRQYIDSKNPNNPNDIDLLAAVVSDGFVCIHWVSVRGGRHVGDKSFFPDTRHDPEPNLQDYAEAFVAQHYLGKDKPDIIISNFSLPESLQQALIDEQGRQIQFVTKTIGERKVWMKMAEQNARIAIGQRQLQQSSQQNRIEALAKVLNMDSDGLKRLECFDISHMQGEATIASCVVYDEQAMQSGQYRRYNITTAKAGDDYAAMREVLIRRYGKMQQAEANGEAVKWPDAVLIDGGKGQIGVAVNVWEELGLTIPLIGIAKGPERKAGLEELILPFTGEVFRLPPDSPALHLLQTVRDESHRFAITGHRKKRDKARVTSSLTDIPGVGSKRRKALLTRFGGLRGVAAASKEDLAQVEGISSALAEKIYEHLH
ncbi:excinuclease ABC subunit UvrC [Neisseria weixii]|uniref:UvrABC system protein C n=1 Tax=Neisseria weixii TaxID=1853276 RepID=A0A3N4MJ58_9NEIS|nr:excinuclease ABC subunit UvrC [Neisseria weixii]ATD65092.1 excinuclease ABC subunit C [Neisseria weixii]RPD83551.1 excinuclease ABC subunit UvrC [Neisseria weixii]RPD83943.1 excinuclease ABC subunit UvrC [Neisseria weixii]